MKTEFDENVLDYWRIPSGNFIVKMKKDDELDKDCHSKNTLPSVLGVFIIGKIKRIMNIFITEINGFYNNNIFYRDTDRLYIEKKYSDVLDEENLVGESLCLGKNYYKSGGTLYGLFVAPKIKYFLTLDKCGNIQGYKNF